ncbi:MAG: HAD-IA family hydrolase [Chloroflexi bacterium]|nr:HAD-IA family hydrolase [Chloroflexota bacterium]
MIKAVFFDFYNTLGRFHPPREELQSLVCEEFGIQVTPDGIARGYGLADAYMAQEMARQSLGERSREERRTFFAEYQRLVLKGAGVEVSQEMAGQVFRRLRSMPYGFALHGDAIPTLEALKGKGLALGMLSNNEDITDELCEELGLAPYLDFVVTSSEVGSGKPHPPIFLEALRRANVEPHEAIHVGDQYGSDVKGALGVGIHAVLLDRDGLNVHVQDCPRIRSLSELTDLVKKMQRGR